MTITNYYKIAVLLLIASAAFASCKKDEPEVFQATNPDKSISLNVEHRWGNQQMDMEAQYEIGGLAVKFEKIKYYLSNFTAQGESESVAFNEFLLVDAATPFSQKLGDVDFAMVQNLDFAIGLDAITNHLDPIEAEYPLNQIDMHWNWNPDAGYKFIVIEGFYDSDGDDDPDAFFDLHVASDAVYTEGTLPLAMPVGINGNPVNVAVDYAQFFDGIDFTPAIWEFEDTHGSTNITNAVATNAIEAISVQ